MPKKRAKVYCRPTDEQVASYEKAVNAAIFMVILRCFSYYSIKIDLDTSLGNTGWTIADLQQHLRTEVFIAISHYDPSVGGSTLNSFVMCHVWHRAQSWMKKFANPKKGWGAEVMYPFDYEKMPEEIV